MPKVKSTRRKRYSSDFKLQAVELTFQAGNSVESVAGKLGISEQSLAKWRNDFKQKRELEEAQKTARLKQENDKLRAELKQLKMDNEILKQAASYFAALK
jgi:transposase